MGSKNFALIGATAYNAPRHMRAIKETGKKIDYVSIYSPHYLHGSHVRFASNIGVHFYDMLNWILGEAEENVVHVKTADCNAGSFKLKNANVRWFLSVNYDYIPKEIRNEGQRTYRSITVDGEEIEFSGSSMVFTNVVNPRAFIERKEELKKTLLKKGCSIGANSTIICGVTIGQYALIGSGAVVNTDVKPHALMVGVPAKQVGWVGISGNTLVFSEHKAKDKFAEYELLEDILKVALCK